MIKKIFIGSSTETLEIAEKIATWIEEFGGSPVLWNTIFDIGESTLSDLIKTSQEVDGAIFVFNADDAIFYRGTTSYTVRDNVLLEFGLFIGKLTPQQVVFANANKPKLPTDLAGITYLNFDSNKDYTTKEKLKKWYNNLLNITNVIENSKLIINDQMTLTQSESIGFEYKSLNNGIYYDMFQIQALVNNYRYHTMRYSWGFGGKLKVKPSNDNDCLVDTYKEGEYTMYTLRLNSTLTPSSKPYDTGVEIHIDKCKTLNQMYLGTTMSDMPKNKPILWVKIQDNMRFKNIVFRRYKNAADKSPEFEKTIKTSKKFIEFCSEEPKTNGQYIILEWEVEMI